MMKKNFVLFMLFASPVFAQTITGNLAVQAQVADVCTIMAENIDFGMIVLAYGKPGYTSTTGKIRVTCTKDTQYTISIGAGQAGDFNAGRAMKNSINGDVLKYNLFSSKNLTIIWGDGLNGTYTLNNVATGVEEVEVINAQLPYSQIATPGTYSDSIVITIDY